VFGVDKFDYEEFPVGLYQSAAKALEVAREKTNGARGWASDHSIATVYYAYGPHGEYLGGDTWVGE
jgi:hypothetical protein